MVCNCLPQITLMNADKNRLKPRDQREKFLINSIKPVETIRKSQIYNNL
jgi:hypothetical protein